MQPSTPAAGSSKRAAGEDDFEPVTHAQRKARVRQVQKDNPVQPRVVQTKYGPQIRFEGMVYPDYLKVSRAEVADGHPFQDTEAMLKGKQGAENNNYPHWYPSLSKALPGVPSMPVACAQIALNAVNVARRVWPALSFNEPIFDCDFPKRYVLLLDMETDESGATGFSIVPDQMQHAQSSALDWEPLFLRQFPMFKRNTVHAISPSSEGEEAFFEYKGSAFSCTEDSLGPDVKANLLDIKEWWELYGFEISRMRMVSK